MDDGFWILRKKRFIGVEISGEKTELQKKLDKIRDKKDSKCEKKLQTKPLLTN